MTRLPPRRRRWASVSARRRDATSGRSRISPAASPASWRQSRRRPRCRKTEGTVLVEIVIDAEGRVARARIVRSVPGLDEAALQAVRQWLFKPAVHAGRPVATRAMAPVRFRIY